MIKDPTRKTRWRELAYLMYRNLVNLRLRYLWKSLIAFTDEIWLFFIEKVMPRARVTCNFCGWCGWAFRPIYYYGYCRTNAMCPNCGVRERHRLFLSYINHTNFLAPCPDRNVTYVLDVGPNPEVKKVISQQANMFYVSVDLRPGYADVCTNLCDAAIKGNQFDVIICCHVLEHIIDDKKAIAEIYRLMRHAGKGIIQVPINDKLDETVEYGVPRKEENNHVRMYGKDYKTRLKAAGFTVECDNYYHNMPRAQKIKLGLTNSADYEADLKELHIVKKQ